MSVKDYDDRCCESCKRAVSSESGELICECYMSQNWGQAVKPDGICSKYRSSNSDDRPYKSNQRREW